MVEKVPSPVEAAVSLMSVPAEAKVVVAEGSYYGSCWVQLFNADVSLYNLELCNKYALPFNRLWNISTSTALN